MEQDLVQRIILLVVCSLMLVPMIIRRGRIVKKELKNGIPPLTLRSVVTRGLEFAIAAGSGLGIIAVFLGMKYDISIGRAIWGSIYGAILSFIVGVILFPLAQLLYERNGTIYRPPGFKVAKVAKRVPPIRSVAAITQGGLAFLVAFLASLATTFLRSGELNWYHSFLVGLGIFLTYFIVLASLSIIMKEEV